MKKTRLSTILLLVLTLLCSILVLASCGDMSGGTNGDETIQPPPEPTKLATPHVVLEGDTATWSANAIAERFEISINGTLSFIESTAMSQKLTDGQTFKVRAIGDGTKYANSDWSNPVIYVKPIEKYTIVWQNGDNVLEIDTNVFEGIVPTYDGAEPTKAADAQYTYEFAGWTPEVVAANGDVIYTAVFNSVVNKYTVTWKNGDTTLETDERVAYGTVPTYNGTKPAKAADAQYTYVFAGWTPMVSAVTENATYTAVFTSVPNTYTVTWKNGDTVLETDENVAYGTVPTYDGAEPSKAADAQYTYVFAGWTPTVSAVTENATYIAVFTSVPNTYTVTWKNGDTTLETDKNVAYGTVPTYNGTEPTKAADAQYTYTFSGWSPQISLVTGSVTYQAQFTETVKSYTVTFYSEDGLTVLDTVTVAYGSNAVYSKSTPVKNATAGYTYVFEKWVTTQGGSVADDLTNVIGDRSVYASFKESIRKVNVHIVSNNTDYGMVSVSVINDVPYGTAITVNGNKVTVNGQTVTANANTATAQYTYTFVNWIADATVGNDTIITANFSRSENSYTVTWKNGDTTLESDENVAYGTVPTYDGAEPIKAADAQYTYVFAGWTPTVSTVDGNVIYSAVFTSVLNTYTVTFCDWDGSVLEEQTVAYGNSAIAPSDPQRNGYIFKGWDKSFDSIIGAITVTAQYEVVKNQVCINYTKNDDGTTTAKFSINGDVNIAMIELQLRFELTNATYLSYEVLVSDSADANYVDGIFYFSFMSADDITVDTGLFSITFTNEMENIGISFAVVDSLISDGSFNNITAVTIVGTTYNS